MNNKKYYPFKRNNYFYGKLLTVRDFQDEQKYINDKRRINNVLTNGVGVVSGLSVLLINEKTIYIESGLALDYMGREILLDESAAKKLNVIDGFKELDNENDAYLCIEYLEEFKEEVYSVTSDPASMVSKNEYNRVNETCRLYLTNTPLTRQSAGRRLIEESNIIYEGNGIKITQTIPKFVNPGKSIDIKIKIERTKFIKALEVDFYIRSAHFKSLNGNDFKHVYYKDEELVEYKNIELLCTMAVDDVFDTETEIEIGNGSVNIGTLREKITTATQKITITKENIYDVTMKKYQALHFDDVLNMTNEIPIYLAKFKLMKNESEYLIKELEAMPFEQYIPSNEMLYTYIRKIRQEKEILGSTSPIAVKDEKRESEISMNCGTEQIEIDMRSRTRTYFSGEIAHGLGKGDVIVQVGVEDFTSDKEFDSTKRVIVGDSSILLKTPYETEMPLYTTAVILYAEKETFRIAIKLLGNAERNEVTVKWWAYKYNQVKEINYAEADAVKISINERFATISPGTKFKFTVTVDGTDNKDCKWSVLDKGGGEIDINGIYEAPSQLGVYEIMAQSIKYPHKKAKTFVVVQ